MGPSHRRRREQQVRASAPRLWQTIRTANHEHQIAAVPFPGSDEIGERGGAEQFACWVKENLAGALVLRPHVEAVQVNLSHFATAVARRAFDVFGGHPVRTRVASLSDEVE